MNRIAVASASAITAITCGYVGFKSADTSRRYPWAFPSPYDSPSTRRGEEEDDDETFNFVPDVKDRFLESSRKWRLKKLVKYWDALDGEETWPWIWTTWNSENGPHFVFINADSSLLKKVEAIRNEDTRNNVTIIVASKSELEEPLEKYYQHGCGIIEGEVEQFEVSDRVLMLTDERIICFDKCFVL
eukprot:g4106.t1